MYVNRKQDRRNFNGKVKFPLRTKSGQLVLEDRRNVHDRRLGNINLEISDAEELGLPDFITTATSYAAK